VEDYCVGLRLLNKTIELSAASARHPKDNGLCVLLGLLVRGEWRRLTSAIFTPTTTFLIFSSFSRPPRGDKNPAKDFCWWDLGGVCLSVVLFGVK
jgi:hypothetical protein